MTAPIFREVRLGDLLAYEPFTGVRQDKEGSGPEVPFVPTSMVTTGGSVISGLPVERTRGQAKGRLASSGDILLVCRGIERHKTVPAALVTVEQDLAFSESLILLRVDPKRADPAYVRLYLTSERAAPALAAAATGTTISYLRPDSLIGTALRLPPIEDQTRIVASLSALQEQLATLEATVGTFRDLVATVHEGMIAGTLRPRSSGPGGRVGGAQVPRVEQERGR